MKFCRFGQRGQEKPGIIDADGKIRDLSGVVPELTIETLAAAKGTRLVIETSGDDAKDAADAIQSLIENNFGEA